MAIFLKYTKGAKSCPTDKILSFANRHVDGKFMDQWPSGSSGSLCMKPISIVYILLNLIDLSRCDFRLSNKAVMQLGCSRVL